MTFLKQRGASRSYVRRAQNRPGLTTYPLLWMAALTGSYVLACALYLTNGLGPIELQTVDARFKVRGPLATSSDIVLVALDARSLGEMNEAIPVRRSNFARLVDILRSGGAQTIVIDVTFAGQSDRPADDELLRSSIRRNGPIVLAADDLGSQMPFAPVGVKTLEGARLASAAVDVDTDGVLRRMMFRQIDLRTLAVVAAEQVTGAPVGDAAFPDNQAWINYVGPPGSFPTYSVEDVLSGRQPSQAFAGKVVLVGVTAPAAKDVFQTPVSDVPMSGLEVHANALQTILDHSAPRVLSYPLGLGMIGVEIILLALLSLRWGSFQILAATPAAMLAHLAAVQFAFRHGVMLPLTYGLLALAATVLSLIAAESIAVKSRANRLDALVRPADWTYFISYRRSQNSFAAAQIKQGLEEVLQRKAVFLDTELNPGANWPSKLHEIIGQSHVVLVLIGPAWLDASSTSGSRRLDDPSDWVRLEIEAALAQPDVKIVPVLLDGASMPSRSQLPNTLEPLADCEAFRLEGGRQFLAEISRLIDTIDRYSEPSRGGSST